MDRYVLGCVLRYFIPALVSVLILFIVGQLYQELSGFLQKGYGLSQIAYYYSLRVPLFLPKTLLLCFMVALLLALGRMNQSNELLLLRASRISPWRVFRSLGLLSLALCALWFWIQWHWIPQSQEKLMQLQDDWKLDAAQLKKLTYKQKDQMWTMGRFDPLRNTAQQVCVIHKERGQEIERLFAESAVFGSGKSRFENGFRMRYHSGLLAEIQPFESLTQDRYRLDPQLLIAFNQPVQELPLPLLELAAEQEEAPIELVYAFQAKLLSPLSFALILWLSALFSLLPGRQLLGRAALYSVFLFGIYWILFEINKSLLSYIPLKPVWIFLCIPFFGVIGLSLWVFRRVRA